MSTRHRFDEPSFHELMAAQLERAPWLGLSLALHGLLLLVLALFPYDRTQPERSVEIVLAPPEPVPEIDDLPPPPPDDIVPEHTPDDVTVVDPVDPQPVESDAMLDIADVAEVEAAFAAEFDNPAIGLGGNAGGPKYGGRPKGSGGLARRPHAPVVQRALEWLARHQDDDGRWDADEFMKHDFPGAPCDGPGNPVHDVGVTGLALLAFLGDGNTLNRGERRDVVVAAVRWLRDQQDPDTGLIGTTSSNEFVYDHAIATLALVEASGLSPARVLRPAAEKALAYLEYHRNPYSGWRYQPRDGDCDTSVTGWCVLAYQSAKDFGFAVNDTALACAAEWLDRMTDPVSGRTGYIDRGGRSSRRTGDHASRFPREAGECMTSVALLCRVFLGESDLGDPLLARQAELVAASPPRWDEASGAIDHYAWYYATYALYQIGGPKWRTWSKALTGAVAATQRQDGNAEGSWDPAGVWGEDGGRVYSTAILCLTLQAYYRYARVLVR